MVTVGLTCESQNLPRYLSLWNWKRVNTTAELRSLYAAARKI